MNYTEDNYRKLKNLILSKDTTHIKLALELITPLRPEPKLISLLVLTAALNSYNHAILEIVKHLLQKFLSPEQYPLLLRNLEKYLQNSFAYVYDDLLSLMEKFDFLDFNELANTLLVIKPSLLSYCIEKKTHTLPMLMRLAEQRYETVKGTFLHLQNCNLKQIPPEIGDFQDLRYLNISGNPLKDLPNEMANLKNLLTLYFEETQLSQESIKKLEKWFPILMADKYHDYYVLKVFYPDGSICLKFSAEAIQEAFTWVEKCICLNPKNAAYHISKGVILDAQDELEEGLRCFDEALRLDPNNALAYSSKAYNLFCQGLLEESLAIAQMGLKVFSQYPSGNKYVEAKLYFHLGQSLYHLKRYEESEANYLKATQIDPIDGASFYNLARIYAVWHLQDKVIQFLRTAVELNEQYFEEAKKNPDFEAYWEDDTFLEALKSE